MLCERAADARVSTPTSTRTGHTTRPHATGHITAAAHPAPPAGYVTVPHTCRPCAHPPKPPASPPRRRRARSLRPIKTASDVASDAAARVADAATAAAAAPTAAAELPAALLEEDVWLAPQKRRLDVRNHRSRQPGRGRSPRSGPISRSDVRPFRGCFFFAAAFVFGDAALSIR